VNNQLLVVASLRPHQVGVQTKWIVRARCPRCRIEIDAQPMDSPPGRIMRDAFCQTCGHPFAVLVTCCYPCQQRRVAFCSHVRTLQDPMQRSRGL